MSQEKTNNIEIDLGQFFKALMKGFKNVLKFSVTVFLFYKKNWILFSILFLIGVAGGYVLETTFDVNKRFKQEIILAPNYDTKSYLYGFVESLETRLRDKLFLKKIDLDSTDILHLKKVILEPIVRSTDVLEELNNKYGNQNFLRYFLENYDEGTLEDGTYNNYYKYHKLTILFKKESSKNAKVSQKFLKYLGTNEYYNKTLSLTLKQTKSDLEKNKETLVFVEDYLDKLSKNPLNQEKEIVVLGEESKIPTITSLLDKKEALLRRISSQEEILTLNTKLFDIVEYNNVVRYPFGIHKRLFVIFPLILCGFVSMVILLKQSSGKLGNFINS